MNLPKDRGMLEKVCREFFKGKAILVVDQSVACRDGIKNLLLDLGVESRQILTSFSISDAHKILDSSSPAIVISEYKIGDHSAVELISKLDRIHMNRLERLFIIVTNNATESAVAEAAEGDVDAYVLKPFSRLVLREYFFKTIYPKMFPNQYMKELTKGIEALESQQWETANLTLSKALELAEKPSIVYYFLGQMNEKQSFNESAFEMYNQGLKKNPIHYRCLTALTDLHERLDNLDEAFKVAKKLEANFPLSIYKLEKIIQLAVYTQNFQEIARYFETFKKLDLPPEHLTHTMTAALYVYAKFLIQTKRVNQGLKSFKEAIITSKYDVDLINKSIRFLIAENYPRDADQFLKLYPPDKKHLPEFVILDLLISFHNESPEFFIQKAKNRFNEGLQSSEITYHYALALNKIGNRVELESVVYEGIEKYPDIAQKLKGLL